MKKLKISKPIRLSTWTVKDIKTNIVYENIKSILVSGDDKEGIKNNDYYLGKVYKRVFSGEGTRRKAIEEKRLKVLSIVLDDKIVGYSNV